MIIIILSCDIVSTIYINSKLSFCEIEVVRIWRRVRLWVNIDVIRVNIKICVIKGEKCLSRLRSIILNEFEHIIDADENFRR